MDVYISFLIVILLPKWMLKVASTETPNPKCDLCHPMEEGKENTLSLPFALPDGNLESVITITVSSSLISKCVSANNCIDYYDKDFKTSLEKLANKSEFIMTLQMNNTTRNMHFRNNNYVYLTYNNNIIACCKMNIFAKVTNIDCKIHLSDEHLRVKCWSMKKYHNEKCSFTIYTFEDLRSRNFNDTLHHQNSASCNLSVPTQKLIPGYYDLLVTLYPNVTGYDSDSEFGISKTIPLNLDYPSVRLNDCPDVIEEDTTVTCKCERSDTSLIKADVGWFDSMSSSHAMVNNVSHLLYYNAKIRKHKGQKLSSEFYCRTIRDYGWTRTNSTAIFSPTVIRKGQTLICNQEIDDIKFTFICKTNRIFPPAYCRFFMKNNYTSIELKEDNIIHHSEEETSDSKYYKSMCMLIIPRENLTQRLFELNVIMYPNVTGDGKDIKYGVNLSVFIDPTKLYSFYQLKPDGETNVFMMIAYFGGGNILLVLIVVLTLCCRRKGSTKILDICAACTEQKKNEYSEINDGYVLPVHHVYQRNTSLDSGEYRRSREIASFRAHNFEFNIEEQEYEMIEDNIIVQVHDEIIGDEVMSRFVNDIDNKPNEAIQIHKATNIVKSTNEITNNEM